MRTVAVVGGAYGDEGKGLMVDYLCYNMGKGGAVVRYQGGAQSGHTVVTPEGNRHVFSHIGSGSMLGLQTILGKDFVCNPDLFLTEWAELEDKPPTPLIELESQISTPYDVILNQELERSRGSDRHGSVGVGFGETIERVEVGSISFAYRDLYGPPSFVIERLEDIREYFLNRMESLGLDPTKWSNPAMITKISTQMNLFTTLTSPFNPDRMNYDYLIFEGGQGLKLDMVYGDFPHVTRSRTGLYNAKSFCSRHNLSLDEVIYVTRAYTTRHGAGPLKNEYKYGEMDHVADETNKDSEFQGKLRFAPLNWGEFKRLVSIDSCQFDGKVKLAMTCMDHLRDEVGIDYSDGWNISSQPIPIRMSVERFNEFVEDNMDYLSDGPTRNDVCGT